MKHVKLFEEFLGVAEAQVNEAKVEMPSDLEGVFVLDKKMPFGLPKGVADYYVSRADGKTGTSKWDSFEELIKANPDVKFGAYANSTRISVFEALKSGQILVMREVYIQ